MFDQLRIERGAASWLYCVDQDAFTSPRCAIHLAQSKELINSERSQSAKALMLRAPQISELERRCLTAASIAQRRTGVPILTHTEAGQCGPDQQDLFE